MRPLRRAWLCALAGLAPFGAAQAQDAPALRLRSLVATCAQCHGTDGRPAPDSIVPALAGLPEATLIERMSAFKDGTLSATVMTQLARGFSEAQIRQLATAFAAQAR
jgi:sulfide dehydrogenase cytochrome subunit